MKYTNEVEIQLPLEQVIRLFDNSDNLKAWQPGLADFEHISGTAGQPGAKSRLKYQMGKREMVLIETITKRNLPDEFAGTYEGKGVFNKISNQFIPLGANKTKWIAHNDFKFSGFMAILAFFMKGTFKKQGQLYLDRFKEFAERQATTV